VATISGVVEDVNLKDKWSGKTNLGQDRGGLSVSYIGIDGVRYYGSHLSKVEPGIAPGVQVVAGQKLGEVGSTGSARGTKPHLHFGISYPTKPGDWEIRRGVIWPWKYLDAWRAGENLSPVKAIKRAANKAKK
jgi:murein DD-endopeptidase MepM/ murein hydrolase activator NlpD